ncbi:MAG: metallophosphoesterase [Pseudobdellovibrionaceae bacterium]
MSETFIKTHHAIPAGTRIYAIGDLHGHLSALQKMHLAIDNDMAKREEMPTTIIYLGDYIDRGPESKALVERLAMLQAQDDGINRVFLRGNHENAFLGFLRDPMRYGLAWLKYGGIETSLSYGAKIPEGGIFTPSDMEKLAAELIEKVPEHHILFMRDLLYRYELGNYLFVHAGVRPGVPLHEQDRFDLVTIREPFLSSPHDHGYRVVHGHTITPAPVVLPNRIGLDTGFYDQGVLTALRLEGNDGEILQISDPDFA